MTQDAQPAAKAADPGIQAFTFGDPEPALSSSTSSTTSKPGSTAGGMSRR
jgi:hypothetical protein